jgi:hypothetical protein
MDALTEERARNLAELILSEETIHLVTPRNDPDSKSNWTASTLDAILNGLRKHGTVRIRCPNHEEVPTVAEILFG